MSEKGQPVPRPKKKAEFNIVFDTRQAETGWRNVVSTQRSAVTNAWDALTQRPLDLTPSNYPMKGELALVARGGQAQERWQHKLTGGARIWFYVEGHTVHLIDVRTRHPNETK